MGDDSPDPHGQTRRHEIFGGEGGPDFPIRYEDLEAAALEAMDEGPAGYLAGGAGGDRTMSANREAFERWRIVPRLLRDVSERDLSVEVLGRTFEVPFMLAPLGIQTILHEEGELATARAAADLNVPVCLSSVASNPMEEVSDALGDTPKWFQLYWSSEPAIMESFVGRAEDAGFDALVLTVDVPTLGWRERDLDQGYLPQLDGEGLGNYFSDPAFRAGLDAPPEDDPRAAIDHWVDVFGNPALDWDDLEDLVAMTDLPVVVKGLLHPDDAEEAITRGADAVAVSNHGGRQLDGEIAALEALPGIVDQTVGRVPVTFDSGIRRGSDVLTALALGADAAMIGRPFACGLAVAGEAGVREVLRNFRADLDVSLANTGRASVADLDRSLLRRTDEL